MSGFLSYLGLSSSSATPETVADDLDSFHIACPFWEFLSGKEHDIDDHRPIMLKIVAVGKKYATQSQTNLGDSFLNAFEKLVSESAVSVHDCNTFLNSIRSIENKRLRFISYTVLIEVLESIPKGDEKTNLYQILFSNHFRQDEVDEWIDLIFESISATVHFLQFIEKSHHKGVLLPMLVQRALKKMGQKNFWDAIFQITGSNGQKLAEYFHMVSEKILPRFNQIAREKSNGGLTNQQIATIATLIETKQFPVHDHVKKQNESDQFSFLVSHTAFYALYKSKVKVLDKNGTYKRVTAALEIPRQYENSVILRAQGVSRAIHGSISYKAMEHELTIAAELKEKIPGISGIVLPIAFWEYNKQLPHNNYQRVYTAIYPLYDHDLMAQPYSIDTVVTVAKIVKMLHMNGYVFGDLKPSNILVKGSEIALCDLGFCQKVSKLNLQNFPSYGSILYSAPELLRASAVSSYLKADIWALGLLLYRAQQQRLPPWSESAPKTLEPSRDQLRRFAVDVESQIAVWKSCTVESRPLWGLMLRMLELNPDLRITIHEVLEGFEKNSLQIKENRV